MSRLCGRGFCYVDGRTVPKCSSHPSSIGSYLASRMLAVTSKWLALYTRKALHWMWPLITLLVGGRTSIAALAQAYPSTQRSSNVSAVVVDLAPSQTRTKYQYFSVSCSDKESASPKLVKYCYGSEVIAAYLVPTLLMQSSPVSMCALITVLAVTNLQWVSRGLTSKELVGR